MELYYKDLISKDSSLDKLVDDLMLIVQGAQEFAEAAGATVPQVQREEIATRLQRLKDGCKAVKAQTKAAALAADKVLHQYPYSSIGFALACGVLTGALLRRRK